MGDLAADTEIERLDDGRFRAAPSRNWEIWGPMGGYIASFALRAVGATVADGLLPASLSAHSLGVARFEPIEISVVERRTGRSAGSHRVWENLDAKPIGFEQQWPSANRPHAWLQPNFIGPTLDVNVAFHRPTASEPWLLADGSAPVSTGGLFGWSARVWSPSGQLHASGGGQCIYRRTK